MNFSFAHPLWLIGSIPIALALWWYATQRAHITYHYPLIHLFLQTSAGKTATTHGSRWKITYVVVRGIFFMLLLGAAAGPRIADERSRAPVQGRAIMLALDMSGSMSCFDDLQQRRSRFSIAQQEALHFIKKRTNDLLGLVLFGAVAVTRCPLTADQQLIESTLKSASLGLVDPQGTVLSVALALAINRLASASAKSKIVVLLTDGEPSHEDIDPQTVLELARRASVTVYTIGIGSAQGGYFEHPMGGLMRVDTPLNDALLTKLAVSTGGKYFRAQNQAELASIYAEIDALETSEHESPTARLYYELYIYCIAAALILLGVELFLRTRWVVL